MKYIKRFENFTTANKLDDSIDDRDTLHEYEDKCDDCENCVITDVDNLSDDEELEEENEEEDEISKDI